MEQQKKPVNNSNVVTLRARSSVLRELEEREETGKTLSSIVDRELSRYYYHLKACLPTFSLQEAAILVKACNGHIVQPETVHLLWAEVEDWLHVDAADYESLIARLKSLSRFECMAVADAIERAWNSPTYHIDNMEERVRKVGLV